MISTRIGIRTSTSQAPSVNLTVVTTIATAPVSVAPNALIASRRRQPGDFSRSQWRTMPDWLMVKSMNTPTAYSGISRCVFAPKPMTSSAATPPSTRIP